MAGSDVVEAMRLALKPFNTSPGIYTGREACAEYKVDPPARHAISADVLFSLPRASWPARALRLPRGATRWTSEPAAPRHCSLLAHAARHRRRCACFLARRWTSAEKTASLWGPDSAKIARAS